MVLFLYKFCHSLFRAIICHFDESCYTCEFFFQFCPLIRDLDFFLQRVFKGTSVRTLNFCIVRDIRDAIGETADVT